MSPDGVFGKKQAPLMEVCHVPSAPSGHVQDPSEPVRLTGLSTTDKPLKGSDLKICKTRQNQSEPVSNEKGQRPLPNRDL
jgi:hypothetical protein